MTSLKKTISIVIPAFNEGDNIYELYKGLKNTLTDSECHIEYIFVDDGSSDYTLKRVKEIGDKDQAVFFIQLSRNFGHQNALKAGLDYATGDCVISMDCDLQHPPEVVLQLLKKWEEGYDVVYTQRKDSKEQSWWKRKTSSLFYWVYNQLSDLRLEKGTADFRLMSRNVVDAFSQLKENELFIRGLVKWAGFRQIAIEYAPNERFAGKTKYSWGKMASFAFNGLMSFSTKPLKLVVYFGMSLFVLSIMLIPYALISYLIGKTVSGWTSLMITVIFFGSLQLLLTAIIGLYISKLVF